jgi:predicted ribosomally synthesized peptide with SipW-like signal peptide
MAEHRRRLLALPQRVQALLALGVLAVPASVGTFAFWTDDVTVTGTTFSTGTLDLKVNALDTVTGYTTLNLTTMVPGSSVAGVLTVRNNGTVALKYTAVTAATNADAKNLRGALVVKVTGDTAVTGSSPSATCAGSALSGTGTALNSGLVTTGRLLAAATEEKLCVQVTLPTTAASSLQGATTDVTFTFTGTSDLS